MIRILLLSALLTGSLCAQSEEPGPWEPGERNPLLLLPQQSERSYSAFTLVSGAVIGFYRSSVSVNSVSRCPFEISCSSFALHAVQRYGAAGIPLVIDRYFYRENVQAFSLYTRSVNPNGLVKLDDALFLSPFE
jgi:hypothetical protein